MTAIDLPKFYLDDNERIDEKEKTLKGFVWLEDYRPMSKQDIFIHRDWQNVIKVKKGTKITY